MDIELDLDTMVAGEPDIEALRALFTELEFTTLLKELVPVMEVARNRISRAEIRATS